MLHFRYKGELISFDKRIQFFKNKEYLVVDGRGSMVSYSVIYFNNGGQFILNHLGQTALKMYTEPLGKVANMEAMRKILIKTNPNIEEKYILNLSGTDISLLWVLSYGRKEFLTEKYITNTGYFNVLDITDAFSTLLKNEK